MQKNEIILAFKENIDKLDKSEFKKILGDLKNLNKTCNKFDSYKKNRRDSRSQFFSSGKKLAKKLVEDIFDNYPYQEDKLNNQIIEMMKKIKYYANTDKWQRLWDLLKLL